MIINSFKSQVSPLITAKKNNADIMHYFTDTYAPKLIIT